MTAPNDLTLSDAERVARTWSAIQVATFELIKMPEVPTYTLRGVEDLDEIFSPAEFDSFRREFSRAFECARFDTPRQIQNWLAAFLSSAMPEREVLFFLRIGVVDLGVRVELRLKPAAKVRQLFRRAAERKTYEARRVH